jgi:Cu+-exporting ATPase
MACCVIAAFVINKIILACEALHLGLDIQYNDAFENSVAFNGEERADRHGTTDPSTTKLSLTGMTCSACTATVENALRAVEGVEEVKVSLQLQQAMVMHATGVKAERLKEVAEGAGYGAEIGTRSTSATMAVLQRKEELCILRGAFANSTMFLCMIVAISIFVPPSSLAILWQSWLSVMSLMCLNVLVQVYAAANIYMNAWRGVVCGRLNMDSMISISSLMGFGLSLMGLTISGPHAETYFQTTAALITVVLGGRYLDSMSRKQSGESLIHLLSNRAERAMIGSGSGKVSALNVIIWIGSNV